MNIQCSVCVCVTAEPQGLGSEHSHRRRKESHKELNGDARAGSSDCNPNCPERKCLLHDCSHGAGYGRMLWWELCLDYLCYAKMLAQASPTMQCISDIHIIMCLKHGYSIIVHAG